MFALLHRHKFLLWSLCIALLVVRVGGAHWHLCFDGNEPPAMLHAGETDVEHHADLQHTGKQHSDIDLNLIEDGLFKQLNKLLPALLAVFALFMLIVPTRRSEIIPLAARYAPRDCHHRLPPLRGPPR